MLANTLRLLIDKKLEKLRIFSFSLQLVMGSRVVICNSVMEKKLTMDAYTHTGNISRFIIFPMKSLSYHVPQFTIIFLETREPDR